MPSKIVSSIKDLVYSDTPKWNIFWALLVVGYFLFIPLPKVPSWKETPIDGWHSAVSFSLAFNGVFCNDFTNISDTYDLRDLSKTLKNIPLNQWTSKIDKSKKKYCSTLKIPFQNHEQGISYLYLGTIKLFPYFTQSQVLDTFHIIKILLLLSLIPVCLSLRLSNLFTLWIVTSEIFLMRYFDKFFPEVAHGFIFAYSIAFFSYLFFLLKIDFKKNQLLSATLLFLLTFFTAFFLTLRTSYTPIVLLSVGLFFYIYLTKNSLSFIRGCFVVFLTMTLTSSWFVYLTSSPINGELLCHEGENREICGYEVSSYVNYHHFWHPIVLSLGSLENDLAKREGIVFDDLIGINLARKVDPKAIYLGKSYEPALKQYYFKLWNKHPWEMVNIYLSHLTVLPFMEGADIVLKKDKGLTSFVKSIYTKIAPVRWFYDSFVNSISYFLVIFFVFFYYVRNNRKNDSIIFSLSYICLWATLLNLETIIVYPKPEPLGYYNLRYYLLSLFLFCLIIPLFLNALGARKLFRPLKKLSLNINKHKPLLGN